MKHPFLALTLLTILIPIEKIGIPYLMQTWWHAAPQEISKILEGQETTRC